MADNNIFQQQSPASIQPSLQPPQQQSAGAPPVAASPLQTVVQTNQKPMPPAPKKIGHKLPLLKILIGVVVLIVAVVLIVSLLPKGQDEEVKLTWWGLWEDPKIVAPIISEFERDHPNVSIEYSKQDPSQYRERLATRIENGTGPDIFTFHNTWYPMFSGALLPLPTDVITQEDFIKNYYPVMQEDLVHNGGIYGIPQGADTLSLFVNTELLEDAGEQVPTTWEDFVSVARNTTVKNEDGTIRTSGAALGTFGNVTHAPDIISLLFIQQGVVINQFGTTPQDEIDALDFYTSFSRGNQSTWDGDFESSLLAFSQGKVALYFGYSWDIFTIQRLNPELAFTIHPVPSLFDRTMTIASYWVNGVSSRSQYQQEALEFMKFLAQKEISQKIYTESAKTRPFGQPYARVDLADTLKDNTLIYPFVSQLPHAKSSVFVSDTTDANAGLNAVSNTYLGNAVNGIILDGSSTQSVVETLDQGIAQVFAQYGIQ